MTLRAVDPKSLGISQEEVGAALARERRQGVRRRLVAIDAILSGKSIRQAALAAKATRGSVERWLKQVRQSGIQSLLVRRRRYPKRVLTPNAVEATRSEIAAALQGQLKPQVRVRVTAVDMLLSGRSIDDTAAFAKVRPNTVKGWLRTVTTNGFAATPAKWQGQGQLPPRQLDADPVALRELAAKEKNPRIRKRMLALACVAEGMNPHAASMRTGLHHHAITGRMRRFRKEGLAAFQDRKIVGRPKKFPAA